MSHPAIAAGNVAVITGGGAGIGLAAAERFAAAGMKVAIADLAGDRLAKAAARLAEVAPGGAGDVLAVATDVSREAEVEAFAAAVTAAFGGVDLLMNNAGIQPDTDVFGPAETWAKLLGVNLWGVIHGVRAFVPAMLERGRAGVVINTGSKQGITTPPGNPAYNVSKAGVKVFTEALAHQLRNAPGAKLTAHLLIPGFVFTELTRNGRSEKPTAAWTPEQTVDFLLERLAAGDFYILCPDNDVSRALDERRILWAAGDVVENRPALSRWDADYAAAFEAFVKGGA
ncbi:hypothetical protein HNP73_000517 [Amaricoccus macauensis]|uniref:Short-chain dehydrogenase n=1 Tax=Amaricoccus macauensis TaxID=57001 RepID=A0A840SL33_9RHOB|nr:SDR family NAD(P)-dependent oxidoreductase [Amaricoccus macauensis]MBB5220596.1 hypothetical protein [Amaricoccus macauensis]